MDPGILSMIVMNIGPRRTLAAGVLVMNPRRDVEQAKPRFLEAAGAI
jgi:hypothetical protein